MSHQKSSLISSESSYLSLNLPPITSSTIPILIREICVLSITYIHNALRNKHNWFHRDLKIAHFVVYQLSDRILFHYNSR